MIRPTLAAFAILTCADIAWAAECRLALVLALDVSSSVDADEDILQRGGMVSALIAPEVQTAFFASDLPVALAVFEWSGRYNQEVLLDWTLINRPADLVQAAEVLAASKRSHNEFPTAMGYALGFAASLLERAPRCLFKTIDMSGDGQNNEGFPPSAAYAEFPFDGVTVNGLVVDAAEFQTGQDLITFYESEVIRGPGSFVEVARGFDDYERALRRKLERELRPPSIGALPVTRHKQPG